MIGDLVRRLLRRLTKTVPCPNCGAAVRFERPGVEVFCRACGTEFETPKEQR